MIDWQSKKCSFAPGFSSTLAAVLSAIEHRTACRPLDVSIGFIGKEIISDSSTLGWLTWMLQQMTQLSGSGFVWFGFTNAITATGVNLMFIRHLQFAPVLSRCAGGVLLNRHESSRSRFWRIQTGIRSFPTAAWFLAATTSLNSFCQMSGVTVDFSDSDVMIIKNISASRESGQATGGRYWIWLALHGTVLVAARSQKGGFAAWRRPTGLYRLARLMPTAAEARLLR